MKILVFSDSHGRIGNMVKVYKKIQSDMVFHLGDSELPKEELKSIFSCPAVMVRGNTDSDGSYKLEEIIELFGHRILITHGNRLGVNFSLTGLIEEAGKQKCDIALFGHTHVPEYKYIKEKDLYIVNPGSIEKPRQYGSKPSWLVLNIEENGIVSFKEMYL